jgi:hypothetical protein
VFDETDTDLPFEEEADETLEQDVAPAIVEPAAPAPWKRQEPITVRATVNLSGLRAGDRVRVDPSDPYTAGLIERGFLVED